MYPASHKESILYPSGVGLFLILTVCALRPENRAIISSIDTLDDGIQIDFETFRI